MKFRSPDRKNVKHFVKFIQIGDVF